MELNDMLKETDAEFLRDNTVLHNILYRNMTEAMRLPPKFLGIDFGKTESRQVKDTFWVGTEGFKPIIPRQCGKPRLLVKSFNLKLPILDEIVFDPMISGQQLFIPYEYYILKEYKAIIESSKDTVGNIFNIQTPGLYQKKRTYSIFV